MNQLIKKYEGLSLKPYLCPAGISTIGYGCTFYENGEKVKLSDEPITQERAEQLLDWYCDTQIKLPNGDFNSRQKDALQSLIFNIGQSAFNKSTLKKAIEAKDWKLAFENWDWIRAGGKILPGLVKRRSEEKEFFFEGLI